MFKSTKEYDIAINKVLTNIRDNSCVPSTNNEFNEYDLGDVIKLCNDRGYIDGIHINQNAVGHYLYSGSPRLTYRGLDFIEHFNQ